MPNPSPIDFHLRVEPLSLTRSPLGTIAGEVWVEFGAIAFPEARWNDLVVTILGWWLTATVSLVSGWKRQATIHFMDGPFEVRLFAKRRDCWQAELVWRRVAGINAKHNFEFAPDPFLTRRSRNQTGRSAQSWTFRQSSVGGPWILASTHIAKNILPETCRTQM